MDLSLKSLPALLSVVFLLFCPASFAEMDGSAEAGTRLYLLAEGTQSAIPERYLRHLCDLIRADESVQRHYKSVSVYRYTPDLASITGKIMASVANRATPDAQALTELSELMSREEHRCWGEPAAGDGITYDRVELLRLEWIGGSMAGELRAQKVIVFPPPRPHGAGPSTGKPSSPPVKPPPPSVGPPEYISTAADPLGLARALGLRFLPIKTEDVLTARVGVRVPESSHCLVSGKQAHCVLLGQPIQLALTVESNLWIKAEEVHHLWTATCHAASRDSASAVRMDDLRARDTVARVINRGTCRFGVDLRAHGLERSLPSENDYIFEAGAILVRTRPGFIVMSASLVEEALRELRYIPFVRSGTNHELLADRVFGGLSVVSAAAVLRFGHSVRDDLIALGPRVDVPEYRRDVEQALVSALDSIGDTLGQELLTSKGRFVEEVEGFGSKTAVWHELLCRELDVEMRKAWDHERVRTPRSNWVSRCSDIIGRRRSELANEATSASRFWVRRSNSDLSRIYRTMPIVQQVDGAQVDERKPVFATVLPEGHRRTEEYSIQGVGDSGEQTLPRTLRVRVARRPPNLGVSPQLVLTSDSPEGGWKAGMSVDVFTLLLDELVRVDGSFTMIGKGGVRLQASANVNMACIALRIFPGGDDCDLVVSMGGGYEFTWPYPFYQVRLGYNFGSERWFAPELVFDLPASSPSDGTLFRIAVGWGMF